MAAASPIPLYRSPDDLRERPQMRGDLVDRTVRRGNPEPAHSELQRPVQDREPETTLSRLAALNNAFDALKAEQAARQHLFHLRRDRDAIQPARPWGQPREGKMPAADRPTLRTIAIDRIYPGTELRHHFPDAELDELAESIRRQGVLQPLLVRPRGDDFEIIAGARRWRAAQRAQLHEVPVILHTVGDAETL